MRIEARLRQSMSIICPRPRIPLMVSLKIKIRNLERQLGEMQVSSDGQQSASALNKMLEESNRARDRYQADYLAIRGEVLKLQAQLEYIKSGKGGDG
jgi:protein HOOK3